MKKTLFLSFLFVLMFLAVPNTTLAQQKTPTPTPSKTKASPTQAKDEGLDQIQKIKDIVASKVAELNLVEKRGFLGTVVSTSNSQIIVKDTNSIQRIIDIDDLTKFSGTKDESFGISDIKPQSQLIFIGLYNKDSKHLLARHIQKPTSIPTIISGIVSEINSEDFTFTLISEENIKTQIDVEKSTKTLSLLKGEDIVKSGFSKIKLHERVLVVGLPDPNDPKRLNALRILHFIDIQPSVKMKIHAGVKDASTTGPKKQ